MDNQLDENEGTKVKGADLLNLLNYVNFTEGTIYACFRHTQRSQQCSFQAFPRPLVDDTLVCRWVSPGIQDEVIGSLEFSHLLVSDGWNWITIPAAIQSIDRFQAVFQLPEEGLDRSVRKVNRHRAHDTDVQVLQNGLSFEGRLVDFNAVAFQVELPGSAGSLQGVNPEVPVTVLFFHDGRLLYSGECRVTRHEGAADRWTAVFCPTFNNIRRFKAKTFRSLRQVLNPSPELGFIHPLTDKKVSLAVLDVSAIGLSVEEFFDTSVLLPGLILPEITLELGNQLLLRTSGQVLYRNVVPRDGRPVVRCGIVFLDLTLSDQARLAALLHQTLNDKLRVCSAVNMDQLWRFFFESGFIYPSKYAAIEDDKAAFQAVYERLYLNGSEISRHFLFQDRGEIFGHMSMMRAYPRSWLVHHHAATKNGYGLAGVAVLEQISHYINEFHAHKASRMDYVMCYYRKENKFPHRVFGGTFRDVADPKGISLDAFAYLSTIPTGEETPAYQLFPTSKTDREELERWYETASGGLMLRAMNLTPQPVPGEELSTQYRKLGFRQEYHVFSLKRDGKLLAVITLNLTDLGLNLSNLTHCFHALVMEPIDADTLFSAVSALASHHGQTGLPLLVYPPSYLTDREIPFDKEYTLWVLSLTHDDEYMKALASRFKKVNHAPV